MFQKILINEDEVLDFIQNTKIYQDVLNHRSKCIGWKNNQPCIECFGYGLKKFVLELLKEWNIKK